MQVSGVFWHNRFAHFMCQYSGSKKYITSFYCRNVVVILWRAVTGTSDRNLLVTMESLLHGGYLDRTWKTPGQGLSFPWHRMAQPKAGCDEEHQPSGQCWIDGIHHHKCGNRLSCFVFYNYHNTTCAVYSIFITLQWRHTHQVKWEERYL